ncbi:MAG: YlxR family protein [Candidatus Binatia bacterium]
MKRGHRPERTCLGCGARDDKSGFLRIGASSKGELYLNMGGRGRGGYLHKEEACWEAFSRKKKLYRTFRLEVGQEAREKLIRELRDRRLE